MQALANLELFCLLSERKCKRRINKPNKFMISRNRSRQRRKHKRRRKPRHKKKQLLNRKYAKLIKEKLRSPATLVQLYNIRKDPLEKHNISRKQPNIVRKMLDKLQEFYITSVPPCYPINEKVHPKKKAWGPWKDGSGHQDVCSSIKLQLNR